MNGALAGSNIVESINTRFEQLGAVEHGCSIAKLCLAHPANLARGHYHLNVGHTDAKE